MMNPQFGSQYQSGYGPGAPPFSGHQAPAPRQPMPAQNVYNGPNIGQRPSGPRGKCAYTNTHMHRETDIYIYI